MLLNSRTIVSITIVKITTFVIEVALLHPLCAGNFSPTASDE